MVTTTERINPAIRAQSHLYDFMELGLLFRILPTPEGYQMSVRYVNEEGKRYTMTKASPVRLDPKTRRADLWELVHDIWLGIKEDLDVLLPLRERILAELRESGPTSVLALSHRLSQRIAPTDVETIRSTLQSLRDEGLVFTQPIMNSSFLVAWGAV